MRKKSSLSVALVVRNALLLLLLVVMNVVVVAHDSMRAQLPQHQYSPSRSHRTSN